MSVPHNTFKYMSSFHAWSNHSSSSGSISMKWFFLNWLYWLWMNFKQLWIFVSLPWSTRWNKSRHWNYFSDEQFLNNKLFDLAFFITCIIIIIIIKRYTRHNTSKHAVWSEASFTQPTNRQTKQIQQQRAQPDSMHHQSQFFETWSTTPHPPNFPHWNLDPTIWHSQIILPQTLSPTFNTSSQLFTPNLHLKNSAFRPSLRGTSKFRIYYQRTNVFQTLHLQEQLVS